MRFNLYHRLTSTLFVSLVAVLYFRSFSLQPVFGVWISAADNFLRSSTAAVSCSNRSSSSSSSCNSVAAATAVTHRLLRDSSFAFAKGRCALLGNCHTKTSQYDAHALQHADSTIVRSLLTRCTAPNKNDGVWQSAIA